MMIVKKINNNVAIGVDGNGHEVVLFGKGIGFGELPYSINDMSKIERSFYDIDYRYYNDITICCRRFRRTCSFLQAVSLMP